ncbi:MAG: cbb3-type cytochrome oxidase assembly protein CcoS [Chitinophagaceae bacterium]|uniref:cbb3-type cytochrome oxidase assembly protein CcoS n=1 Tax=Parasegetibacter sp. NRK P23 TaxID=2942999 RepID=UPI00204479DD|nr:cbb3-type cytochrome oxidase assembly protein CcoS [Parasegetibacter sp. NRK P23]MCM5529514.1 cbb3-type cytochrome oxidase assembly protein CcoS [Parasegetibacter sp. NRK P23]
MQIILLLLIISLSIAALFLGAFLWSVRTGQYEDEEAPPVRILFDDQPKTNTP